MSEAFIEKYALFVILGHYGSGKTNLALNMALKLCRLGRKPLLVDLDVVNPYFRSTDYHELIDAEGIRLLGPVFGSSNLDAPSLSPGIDTAIAQASLNAPVILDVGGDADGVRALARFVPTIKQVANKLVLAVINTRRPETQSVEGNLVMLDELSSTSSLTIDALVGNTHLAEFTTLDTVTDSVPVLKELALSSGLPLAAVTIPVDLPLPGDELFMPIKRLVKTSWQ